MLLLKPVHNQASRSWYSYNVWQGSHPAPKHQIILAHKPLTSRLLKKESPRHNIVTSEYGHRQRNSVHSSLFSFKKDRISTTALKSPIPKINFVHYSTSQDAQPTPEEKPKKPLSLLAKYASLSKLRLSSLVITTAVFGNLLAPGPIDPQILLAATLGTSLTCFSANSINQYIEVDNDFKMKRTRNRMLPSGQMSLNHALMFGLITGATGTSILALYTNPLAATLAFSNILLYTLVYTPMKRVHPINTWIGSIVGAIPPMIGWAAQTGGLEPGAWVLFSILAIWQMPHFYALSYPLRFDYGGAGYKMLANVHTDKVAPKTLLYTSMLLLLAPFSCLTGLTSWYFILDSTIVTSYFIYKSYLFYRNPTNETAMGSFKTSLWYLPILMALMFIHLNFDKEDEDEALALSEE